MTITIENSVSLVINSLPPARTVLNYGGVKVKRLKPTQKDCVDTLLPARCSTIDSPTGSGKSVSIMVIADQRLRLDTSRLALICVPQTQIADNFTDVTYVWGRNNHTLTTRRFCGDGPDVVKSSRVQELLKWLRRDHALYSSDRAAIVSHAGLVRLWASLDVEQRIDVFASVDLYVDEAHHIEAVSAEDANLLGQVIKSAVASETFTSVTLVTATMFRGDVTPLLTQEELSVFTRWQLSWEENFKEMQWLRRFDMSYVFGDNWQQTVDHVITSARKKDIVYLPAANSNLNAIAGGKYKGVENVLETYRTMLGEDATITYTDECIHLVRSMDGKQVLRVLDLVTERDRSKKKAYFNRMRSATSTEPKWGREMLDVVITLNMMKEGADWIWAERIVLMGKRDSFVDQLQILGRLLRDAPGKLRVELVNVLMRPYDEDNLQAKVNHQVNNILRAMILETIMAPTRLVLPGVGRYSGDRRNWLVDFVPNADDRMQVLEKAATLLASTTIDADGLVSLDGVFDTAVGNMANSLSSYKLDADAQISIAHVVRRMLMAPVSEKASGNDLELVQVIETEGFLSLAARCGLTTLQSLREHLRKGRRSVKYEECLDYNRVHCLSPKTWKQAYLGGKLPPGFPREPKGLEGFDHKEFWGKDKLVVTATYEECLDYNRVHCLSARQWSERYGEKGLPKGFPSAPQSTFKSELIPTEFWPKCKTVVTATYEQCLAYNKVAKLSRRHWGLKWKAKLLPKGFPRNPERLYETEFDGDLFWARVKTKITSTYEQCLAYNKVAKLSYVGWEKAFHAGRLPKGFPFSPRTAFKKQFDPVDFWGTVKRRPKPSYKEALELNNKLKCSGVTQWRKAKVEGLVPEHYPSIPNRSYVEFDAQEFYEKHKDANTGPTSKSVVEKPSKNRFEVKRYSTSANAVRP